MADPVRILVLTQGDVARFWSKVAVADDSDVGRCWEWTARKYARGYGAFYFAASNGRRHQIVASRVSYSLAFGEIPPGMMVCHHCDNPACVRPSHLFLGTAADNVADCLAKGRLTKVFGESHGRAKLDAVKVREIRRLTSAGCRQKDLAKRCGVSAMTISNVVLGKLWRHVGDEP